MAASWSIYCEMPYVSTLLTKSSHISMRANHWEITSSRRPYCGDYLIRSIFSLNFEVGSFWWCVWSNLWYWPERTGKYCVSKISKSTFWQKCDDRAWRLNYFASSRLPVSKFSATYLLKDLKAMLLYKLIVSGRYGPSFLCIKCWASLSGSQTLSWIRLSTNLMCSSSLDWYSEERSIWLVLLFRQDSKRFSFSWPELWLA